MIRDIAASVSGYPGLFAFCAISGLLVPLPEDVSLIYAGVRLQSGQFSWAPTLVATILGVGTRDVVAYLIGRWLGSWLLQRGWTRRWIGARRIDRAQALIARRGPSAVLIGRFLIGFRASVFMVAGATGVSLRQFVFWDGLGLVIAVPTTLLLGYLFGAPLADLMLWSLQRVQVVVGVGIALGLVWMLWRGLQLHAERDDM